MNLEGMPASTKLPPKERQTTADKWILSRLNRTIETVNARLATYDMDDAMRAIYVFLWDEFCDWYVELVKPRLRDEGEEKQAAQAMLAHVLETTLRLMHPMIPFVTEEIWQAVMQACGTAEAGTIMTREYPQFDPARIDETAERHMEGLIEAVRTIRNMRAGLGLAPGQNYVPASADAGRSFSDNNELICHLARLEDLQMRDSAPTEGQWASAPIAAGQVFLETGSTLDIPKELERIAKELEKAEKDLVGLQGRLGNPQFIERAATEVVEKARAQAAELVQKISVLHERRAALKP
jgi:valyl-tRNA synthetase